jgi:hypothetical protein
VGGWMDGKPAEEDECSPTGEAKSGEVRRGGGRLPSGYALTREPVRISHRREFFLLLVPPPSPSPSPSSVPPLCRLDPSPLNSAQLSTNSFSAPDLIFLTRAERVSAGLFARGFSASAFPFFARDF